MYTNLLTYESIFSHDSKTDHKESFRKDIGYIVSDLDRQAIIL